MSDNRSPLNRFRQLDIKQFDVKLIVRVDSNSVSAMTSAMYVRRYDCRRTSTRSYSCWIYAVQLSRRAVPTSCTCTASTGIYIVSTYIVNTSSGVPPAVRHPHGRTHTTCTPPLVGLLTSCSGGKWRGLVAPSG